MLLNRNSVLFLAFWAMTLVLMCGTQVLSNTFLDAETAISELIDYEESEESEKDAEEKESEKNRAGDEAEQLECSSASGFFANARFEHGFPSPPYLERLSPPPDMI